MTPLQEAAHLAHWQSATMRRRIDEAQEIIRKGVAMADGPVWVSFSGGKDSAVMLHLAHALLGRVDARIILWPESDLISNFGQVIAQWRERWPGVQITEVHLMRDGVDDSAAGRWGSISSDTGAYLIGLRAEESRARRMTLGSHGVLFRAASGLLRVSPLAWWRTADVAAYTVAHGLPLLDNYASEGFKARTATRVPRRTVRAGFLEELKRRDMSGYTRLLTMYPELCGY